ncbi:MAG: hypothetical protein N5833_05730, partial [Lactobacillus iners]|nr:hypothetical protein [Lactobacillus iners]
RIAPTWCGNVNLRVGWIYVVEQCYRCCRSIAELITKCNGTSVGVHASGYIGGSVVEFFKYLKVFFYLIF